jgi:hypothetical protein
MKKKFAHLNMRIERELSNGLSEYIALQRIKGITKTKTGIVEKYLWKLLKKEGLLSKKIINKKGKKYE